MISKLSFEKGHLERMAREYGRFDPSKIETSVFAFGLLEELIKPGLPLPFKDALKSILLGGND